MARAQIAYLNRKDVPERKTLQAAIHKLGFKLVLDESYALFETKGYLPCTLDGEDAGFDLRFEAVTEGASLSLDAALAGRDEAMRFRWSGDPREQIAALAVCAALVDMFGAIVHDPERDKLIPLEELLTKARQASETL